MQHCGVQGAGTLKALCDIRLEKAAVVSPMASSITPCKAPQQCAPNAELHTVCLQGAGAEGAV